MKASKFSGGGEPKGDTNINKLTPSQWKAKNEALGYIPVKTPHPTVYTVYRDPKKQYQTVNDKDEVIDLPFITYNAPDETVAVDPTRKPTQFGPNMNYNPNTGEYIDPISQKVISPIVEQYAKGGKVKKLAAGGSAGFNEKFANLNNVTTPKGTSVSTPQQKAVSTNNNNIANGYNINPSVIASGIDLAANGINALNPQDTTMPYGTNDFFNNVNNKNQTRGVAAGVVNSGISMALNAAAPGTGSIYSAVANAMPAVSNAIDKKDAYGVSKSGDPLKIGLADMASPWSKPSIKKYKDYRNSGDSIFESLTKTAPGIKGLYNDVELQKQENTLKEDYNNKLQSDFKTQQNVDTQSAIDDAINQRNAGITGEISKYHTAKFDDSNLANIDAVDTSSVDKLNKRLNVFDNIAAKGTNLMNKANSGIDKANVGMDKFKDNVSSFGKNNNFASKYFAKGGEIKGKGTGKSDSIKAKVEAGAFVVPVEKVAKAKMIKKELLETPKEEKAEINHPNGVDVKLSNGEFMFSKEEVDELKGMGIDMYKELAPESEDLKEGEVETKGYAGGGSPSSTGEDKFELIRKQAEDDLKKKYPNKKVEVVYKGDYRSFDEQNKAYKKGASTTKSGLHQVGGARDFNVIIDGRVLGNTPADLKIYKDHVWKAAESNGAYHLKEGEFGSVDPYHISLVEEKGDGTAFKRLVESYPALADTDNFKNAIKFAEEQKAKNPKDTTYDGLIAAKEYVLSNKNKPNDNFETSFSSSVRKAGKGDWQDILLDEMKNKKYNNVKEVDDDLAKVVDYISQNDNLFGLNNDISKPLQAKANELVAEKNRLKNVNTNTTSQQLKPKTQPVASSYDPVDPAKERAKIAAERKAVADEKAKADQESKRQKGLADNRYTAAKKAKEQSDAKFKASQDLIKAQQEYNALQKSYETFDKQVQANQNTPTTPAERAMGVSSRANTEDIRKNREQLLQQMEASKAKLMDANNRLSGNGGVAANTPAKGGMNYLAGNNNTSNVVAPPIGGINTNNPLVPPKPSNPYKARPTINPDLNALGQPKINYDPIVTSDVNTGEMAALTENGQGYDPNTTSAKGDVVNAPPYTPPADPAADIAAKKGFDWNNLASNAIGYGLPLLQTAIGFNNLRKAGDRPINTIDPTFLNALQKTTDIQSKADLAARYGYTQDQLAFLNTQNVNATNAARTAARNLAGGNAATAFNLERAASNDAYGRALQSRISDADLKLQKQNIAADRQGAVNEMSLQKQNQNNLIFNNALNAWQQKTQNAAGLANTGMQNLLDQYGADKRLKNYSELMKTANQYGV